MLRILTLKIHQGTKFLTLIKLIFRLFVVIIFGFNGIIKQNIILGHDFQRAIFEIIAFCQIIAFPRIIAPFRCEKKKLPPGIAPGNTVNCALYLHYLLVYRSVD